MPEFRRADIKDIADLINLRIEFLKEVQNVQNGERDRDLFNNLNVYFTENMNKGNFISWIAVVDNKIAGTSGLTFYTTPPSFKNMNGMTAYIMNMYTIPVYRRKGIAFKLFELTLNEAKSLGYKKICLHATEKGCGLYEKFGFYRTSDEMVLEIK